VTVSAAVSPKRKQNLIRTRCSFKSARKISPKTMTGAQEKNHTYPTDLSTRTPLGQLMRRAVTYTHQAGADGSTAPLPSIKKFSLFLGPPPLVLPSFLCTYSKRFLQLCESYQNFVRILPSPMRAACPAQLITLTTFGEVLILLTWSLRTLPSCFFPRTAICSAQHPVLVPPKS